MPPWLNLVLRNAAILSLTAGVAELFQLGEGVFMVLAALMTLEGSIGQGQVAGRERIVGTLCGTAVCLLILGLLDWRGVPAATLGLALVRVLGHGLGLSSGFIVGGHVVAGSVAHHTSTWYAYVSGRSIETILGVLAGMLAARWILPVRASQLFDRDQAAWIRELAAALRAAAPDPQGLRGLRERRDRLLDQLGVAGEELPPSPAAQGLAHRWDRRLFHGGALLGCLRDLSALLPQVPAAAAQECRQLLASSADRLDGRPIPVPLDLLGRRLERRCSADAPSESLALLVHRSQLIAWHSEEIAAASDQPPPETKRSIR